jgi:hypothetical protein
MAQQWQLRRGNTAQNNAFTGAVGEVTADTTTGALRVHNGTKAGGYMVDSVVAYQVPTSYSTNGLTWYRKYSSGWVEMGGVWELPSYGTYYKSVQINLPVTMSNTNYSVVVTNTGDNGTAYTRTINGKTTSSFLCKSDGDTARYNGFNWYLTGMAA